MILKDEKNIRNYQILIEKLDFNNVYKLESFKNQ